MTTTSETTPPHETTSVVVKTAGPDGCPSCQAEGQAVTTWRISTRHHTTTLASIQEAYIECASCLQTSKIVRKQPNTLGKILNVAYHALATTAGLTFNNAKPGTEPVATAVQHRVARRATLA